MPRAALLEFSGDLLLRMYFLPRVL